MTFSFDTAAAQGAVIKVIGVGGGGGNAFVNHAVNGVSTATTDTNYFNYCT